MKKIALSFFPLFFAGYSFINSGAPVPASSETTAKQYDGPYVLYSRKKIAVKYVVEKDGLKEAYTDYVMPADKAGIVLTVLTDEPGKTFSVQLKDKLVGEKSDYEKPAKIVAISDIEGNFTSFRELLLQCGVIDTSYSWTFGDGHLVLLGDFVDRGNQITEVLWLIYSLEDKAKAAGGHVHFIMGNHEIMNLSGDLRYLPSKYTQNAKLLRENYAYGLYGINSELGRWLRTKNIIEKIGDILFVHAGISVEMNRMYIPSLNRINEIARPYYTDRNYINNDQRLQVIFGEAGPLWYRGYYIGKSRASIEQIDNTLETFGVKQIITGHSLVADTISVSRDGKVINLDVHHAGGHSEALFIEGEKEFRITKDGEKFPLMGIMAD
jgi:hypothetical protein